MIKTIYKTIFLCNQKLFISKSLEFKIFFHNILIMDRIMSFYLVQSLLERNITFPNFLNRYGLIINIIPQLDSCVEIIKPNGEIVFTIESKLFEFLMKINREVIIIQE